jgi:hypothetical protein
LSSCCCLRKSANAKTTVAVRSRPHNAHMPPLVHRYTKMGHSGNTDPTYIVPTAIAAADDGVGGTPQSDLDYFVGDEVRAVLTEVRQKPLPSSRLCLLRALLDRTRRRSATARATRSTTRSGTA